MYMINEVLLWRNLAPLFIMGVQFGSNCWIGRIQCLVLLAVMKTWQLFSKGKRSGWSASRTTTFSKSLTLEYWN